MKQTTSQRCARVVTALEDLVAQEAVALQALDFAGVAVVQDRAAELVSFLVSQAREGLSDPSLAARVRAIQARREETSTQLESEITRTRAELAATNRAQRQAAQVAPAYGKATGPRRQLSAVG